MDKLLIQKRVKELLEKISEPKKFREELQALLQYYVNKEATKNYQRIIPNSGKFYGVPKPILGVIAAEIGRYLQNESKKPEELLKSIWNEGSYEGKQIAAKSLRKFGPKNQTICLEFVSSVLLDIDNWSVCDVLAMSGVEPIVYINPKLVLPLSEKWIENNNKWIKRFGVVTLRGCKKIETTEKVFKILETVMDDNEKVIKKAVSWILREITKKNPEKVAEFLIKWAKANPSKNTRWIIKDSLTKLPEEKQTEILNISYLH